MERVFSLSALDALLQDTGPPEDVWKAQPCIDCVVLGCFRMFQGGMLFWLLGNSMKSQDSVFLVCFLPAMVRLEVNLGVFLFGACIWSVYGCPVSSDVQKHVRRHVGAFLVTSFCESSLARKTSTDTLTATLCAFTLILTLIHVLPLRTSSRDSGGRGGQGNGAPRLESP